MMVPEIMGIVFGILAVGALCLEIHRNPIMSPMSHAAFGIRRRVRCLLAG